jgi:hypothetical protein
MPAKRTYQAQRTPETPSIPGALPLDRSVVRRKFWNTQ